MGYKGKSLTLLENHGASVGDKLILKTSETEYSGILMPRSEYTDDSHVVIKLKTGYNIGLNVEKILDIRKLSKGEVPKYTKLIKPKINTNLPKVAIISTGGTIASRVDYRTGGVSAALSAEDLYFSVPELSDISQIECEILYSLHSENISVNEWRGMAKKIFEKFQSGVDGIILAHGTDTMGYTAAALSFALHNIPIPVLLVGAQRSSDRPSSDSATNLIGAVRLASDGILTGVNIVMHEGTGDDKIVAHHGTKVRKNHTSSRSAFESINTLPVAYVKGNNVEYLVDAQKSINPNSFTLLNNFEDKVHLIKFHPESNPKIINYLVDDGYRGIVIEGSGLGHVSGNWHESLRYATERDVLVGMTSQCLFGRVRMTVYEAGRDLLSIGVLPLEDILPETALVKMMWTLANSKDLRDAKRIMLNNIAREYSSRTLRKGNRT